MSINTTYTAVSTPDLAMKSVLATRLLHEIAAEAGTHQMIQILMSGLGRKVPNVDRRTFEVLSQMPLAELMRVFAPTPQRIDSNETLGLEAMSKKVLAESTDQS